MTPDPADNDDRILDRKEEVVNFSAVSDIADPISGERPILVRVTSATAVATKAAIDEGIRQVETSIQGGKPVVEKLGKGTKSLVRGLWAVLAQPVWVPAGKKRVKKTSRGMLFVVDIVRFGGTFAVIFGALFLTLNYQSFGKIAASELSIFIAHPSLDTSDKTTSGILGTLKAEAALADEGRENGELFSYLPTVGPPDDRIIIPKLGLNVPIVTPSIEALLKQDWAQVETDIQTALEFGVVHYPGTARPGQAGNFFVTGHSSYYPWAAGHYKTVFARLHELNPGDEYWVYFNGDKHRYVVQSKKEVLPSDTTVLDQPGGQRISTLMTCTPVGTTLRRLVVIAHEVDVESGNVMEVGEQMDGQVVPKVQLEALPI